MRFRAATHAMLIGIGAICLTWTAPRALAEESAQRIVHLLDYIAVDYGAAVQGGVVKSADEYREMEEFAAQVGEAIDQLHPPAPLPAEAAKLARLVAEKAEAEAVARLASSLRWGLIQAFRLQVSPRAAPPPGLAAPLYARLCSSCHGPEGRGDGPSAAGRDPPPANFHADRTVAERSLYGLYNSISLGIPGTAMPAFSQISEDERWALAFHVGSLGLSAQQVRRGESVWRSADAEQAVRKGFPDLRSLTTVSRKESVARHGQEAGLAYDYLRAHPEAVQSEMDPLSVSRAMLARSLAAYQGNRHEQAHELAIAAYLEGFELAEANLNAVNPDLLLEIERAMLSLRSSIKAGEPAQLVGERIGRIDRMLARAGDEISGKGLTRAGAFLSAFVILLREGLEAILLLAAIMAFVAKTGRKDAMPWLHAGWILALVSGALTWFAAQYLFEISGANRETTEGMTALLAAGMLLYVGFWLHGKSKSLAWQKFLRDKVGTALERRTLWAMAGVSFLAVYRELFELVLFYQALWAQARAEAGGPAALLGGLCAALAILAAAGQAIFRYGVRLPLGPLFQAMLWLVLLFAVVFAGDGVAKLQEAGAVSASPIRFPELPALGVHATLETLGVQLAVVALVAAGFWALHRGARPAGS